VLIAMGNHLASVPREANAREASSTILQAIGYIVLVSLISLLGGIMILIALWRLGDTYPQYGGDVLKIGLVLWIIGYALQVFQVGGGGLLALVGTLVLLYGLTGFREELGQARGRERV